MPSSYDKDNNLAEESFTALAALLEFFHESDRVLISYLMEKINLRLVDV